MADFAKCKCHLDARKYITQKPGPNKGKPFFVCPKPQTDSTRCDFFKWSDGYPTPAAIRSTTTYDESKTSVKRPNSCLSSGSSAALSSYMMRPKTNDNEKEKEAKKESQDTSSIERPSKIPKGFSFNNIIQTDDSQPAQSFFCQDDKEDKTVPADLPVLRCECKLVARRLPVKKDGPNKGRWFYVCALNQKEEQCKYFKWESDVCQKDPHPADKIEVIANHEVLDQQLNNNVNNYTNFNPNPKEIVDYAYEVESKLVEEMFVKLAESQTDRYSFTVTRGSPYERRIQYKDFYLARKPYNEEDFYVKIRPADKFSSTDTEVQYDMVKLQIHGTRPSDLGWIIAGQAQFIVFQLKESFLLCYRKRLWRLMDDYKTGECVERLEEAINGRTFRYKNGRHDVECWIAVSTLRSWNTNHSESPLIYQEWKIPKSLLQAYEKMVQRARQQKYDNFTPRTPLVNEFRGCNIDIDAEILSLENTHCEQKENLVQNTTDVATKP